MNLTLERTKILLFALLENCNSRITIKKGEKDPGVS
jgi:hypothetical protein